MSHERAVQLASLLVKSSEGFEPKAYPDPTSDLGLECTRLKLPMREYEKVPKWERYEAAPWTVGWGFTGKDVTRETTMTLEQADARIKSTLSWLVKRIDQDVARDLNDNQMAALASFAYNLGLSRLERSTLWSYVQAGQWLPAADQFHLWDKARGADGKLQTLPGLTKRRKAERDLFLLLPQR